MKELKSVGVLVAVVDREMEVKGEKEWEEGPEVVVGGGPMKMLECEERRSLEDLLSEKGGGRRYQTLTGSGV